MANNTYAAEYARSGRAKVSPWAGDGGTLRLPASLVVLTRTGFLCISHDAPTQCKASKCRQPIAKGQLRLAKQYPSDRFEEGGSATDWFHPPCLFASFARVRSSTRIIRSAADIEG